MTNESHYRTAYNVATEGIVLLKNEAVKKTSALLPVDFDKYEKVLVVGDNAVRNLMAGGGSSELKPKLIISPLDALKKQFGDKIEFAQGYAAGRPRYGKEEGIPQRIMDSLRNDAVQKASNADLVIFMGGLNKNHFQDCEGGDRKSFGLPFGQDELIEEILNVNKNVVVVITSGNAVAMPWEKKVPSIIQSWYLGSIGGKALADILTGKVNPSGKLPFSYPVKLEDCPAHYFGTMSYPGDSIKQEYKEDILVGYRWFDTKKIKPLYSFGHGLSYTRFSYSQPSVSGKVMSKGGELVISVKVRNTGKMKGKETVQLYIGDEKSSLMRPKKELKGFCKVELAPNEEKEVRFKINEEHLKFFDDRTQSWTVEPGKFKAFIAASSDNVRATLEFEYR